jgi:putative transposase
VARCTQLRERLDRTLIWNQTQLRRILRAYEIHHNQHRPHRSLDSAALLNRYPTRSISATTASDGRTYSADPVLSCTDRGK